MASQETIRHAEPAWASYINDPRIRGVIYQLLLFIALVAFVWWVVDNTVENLQRAKIASGFAFLRGRAGFDISQSLISYSSDSTFSRALLVGLLNTVMVAVAGVVTASIVGFLVGIGRLSRNWLIRKISTVYVEVFRNIPPLLVIFFWYLGVLAVLPLPRDSYHLPFGSYLNSRGFFLPRLVWGEGAGLIPLGFLLAIAMSSFVAHRARQRQMATGQQFPAFWTSVGLIVGLPLLAFFAAGMPLEIEYPKQATFNMAGGFKVTPEFLALYLALSFYTASFIAEIVRAGVLGVSKGQTEAAAALGLRAGAILRLVVVPQALRIIIPPLTSQYLNLTKNSSLAVAIGYPDLVAIGGTILNQTGQSIEVVVIWMVIYLGLSLATSGFMNWFNTRMALVER
ncbi:amino acid ABC transporter permease [Mesorhizobium sp. BAC0120]|uniref:amino acid ABC transporter permease n=1 Tax=Mesorhizobium sp. BAC0120 TaxID=3090670 RepID=UPI00298CA759|nr:amino acid ABC transporter permease [Mesorhizobium sp. BAC0120]MDW6021332.1 amino acid ABC transporter permease [Mesorhizobium sp. BAC0120]